MAATVSPTFRRQLDALEIEINHAFSLPGVTRRVQDLSEIIQKAGGVEASEEIPAVQARVIALLADILAIIQEENSHVVDYIGPWGVRNLALSTAAGRLMRPLGFRQLPGFGGPNPYFIIDEQDAEWMREKVKPGQVWVNATELDVRSYRDLWGAISYQIQAGAERLHPPAGRPKGSISRDRAAVKKQIAAHPEWSDRQIYEFALKEGIWPNDGTYADAPERNKRRGIWMRGTRAIL